MEPFSKLPEEGKPQGGDILDSWDAAQDEVVDDWENITDEDQKGVKRSEPSAIKQPTLVSASVRDEAGFFEGF